MPTLITHPAVALGASPLLRPVRHRLAILLSGVLLCVIPDLDVIAFKLGISYGHIFGHRGFSHSILFAFLASALITLCFPQARPRHRLRVWGYLFVCAVSHGLLDALTDGGLGVGFLIPFSAERYFFAFRPIDVAPLSLERFLDGRGLAILQNEMAVVWVPALMVFVILFWLGKRQAIS